MFTKLKINLAFIVSVISFCTVIISAPYTNMFGKHYKSDLNYTCCKGDQLYIHNFYTTQFFWVEVGNGYTVEAIGKPTPGGCNIQCTE